MTALASDVAQARDGGFQNFQRAVYSCKPHIHAPPFPALL